MNKFSSRIILLLSILLVQVGCLEAQTLMDSTSMRFGGYVKVDFISSWYRNGDISSESSLRDVHLPALIPVGIADPNFNLDSHVKESRFNFDVQTQCIYR